MTAELWIGPAASGRTTTCIQRVQEIKKHNPLASVMVVLPDRRQAAAFRRRMAQAGGALGVEAGTFGDFYQEILRAAHIPIRVASDTVQLRVLRVCLERAASERLEYYLPIVSKPGFLKVLHDRFGELQRADLSPEDFSDFTSGKGGALEELALLYSLYQETMLELGWEDRYSINQRALSVLREKPGVLDFLTAVIVDGFESFNPSQAEALSLVSGSDTDLLVTLPGSAAMHRPVFERFRKSMVLLQGKIEDLNIHEITGMAHLPEALSMLEQRLYSPDAEPFTGGSDINMVEARSAVEEARNVIRWLKARHVRDGIPLYDCAAVVPDMDRYRPLLMEAAAEFGVPLQFTHGEELAGAPPIAALLDVLHLPLSNWPRQLVVSCIHSPYFDFSVDGFMEQDADLLDTVSMYGQVIEGLEQWTEALDRLAGAADPLGKNVGRLELPNLPHGIKASQLLENLESLAGQFDGRETRTTHGWVEWLEDILERFHFFERCGESADRAAALTLRDLLRSLVLSEQVAGAREENLAEFVQELQSVLEAAGFQERASWKKPAVQVLTVLEARGLRFKAAAVMGLAEGVYPGVEREDAFLSEEIRHSLGLEPRLERAQEGLFYLALTRSDRFLLISRPTLAADGENWEPSPYWEAVSGLLVEGVREALPGAPLQLADAASEQEFLFRAVLQRKLPSHSVSRFRDRWRSLQKAGRILGIRQDSEPAGIYEGDLAGLSEAFEERFNAAHIWSASRLEQYAKCPFQFFAGSLMRLEVREPPQPGLDAAKMGSLLHAILEQAYQDARDPADAAAVLEILPQTAARAFDEAPQVYGFRPTAYWNVEKAGMYTTLEKVVEVLGETQAEGGWEPYAYEAPFGMMGAPPLKVVEGDDAFLFRGLIDRIDRRTGGELCVIDYKTGSTHLTRKDYVDGWRLQLPLYALAAQSMGMGRPVEGMYWALLKNEPGRPLLSDFKVEVDGVELVGLEGAVQLARQHTGRMIRAVRGGQFQPVPPDEGCPSYCPAAKWCWRYLPGRRG